MSDPKEPAANNRQPAPAGHRTVSQWFVHGAATIGSCSSGGIAARLFADMPAWGENKLTAPQRYRLRQ